MRNRILIIDNKKINREILMEILGEEDIYLEAETAETALETADVHSEDMQAILLNVTMETEDGTKILEQLSKKSWFQNVPVAAFSDEDSIRLEKKCFSLGAMEFIRRPFDHFVVEKRIKNMIEYRSGRIELEEKVKKQTEVVNKQYSLLMQQSEKMRKSNTSIIDILGMVVECRNADNGVHIKMVKCYTEILANQVSKAYPEYHLDEHMVKVIASASALHDIGKIAIPEGILLKPGKLTSQEYEYMKSHTIRGGEILNSIKDVWDEEYEKVAYEICRYHHERYDGRGYPDGLTGDDIPICAQIVSLVDVYDALVSEKVYKAAYSKEEAFQMIVTGECGMFSPKLLECFRNVRREFEEAADNNRN